MIGRLAKDLAARGLHAAGPIRPGRLRVYGIGAAKTGTTSLSRVFEGTRRSAHEADAPEMIGLLAAPVRDRAREDRALLLRDARRRLDVDASHVNLYFIEHFERLFANNHYVMTLREPVSWLNSFVSHSERLAEGRHWTRFRDLRFGPKEGYGRHEAALEARGLYPLEGYLRHWASAITGPEAALPPERLLALRTEDLSSSAEALCRFVGVPLVAFDRDAAHSHRAPSRSDVLGRIDEDYLLERVQEVCGDVLARHFPGYDARTALRSLAVRS